jgi:peptidoglycan hydrolase-like protein with peptidoglycan-binding domain
MFRTLRATSHVRRVIAVSGRRLGVLVALSLLVAACDNGGADTTTTTTPAETTTTTIPLPSRSPLQPNGPALVSQGDRGPYVEALQFYLVCVGLGRPDPNGPEVSVDGSYGPITAFAVAYYQAQVRRAPSGAPDDETFAMLARECNEPRSLVFPGGETTAEIAGNVGPGDDEVFAFEGSAGQVLHLTAADGAVDVAVEDADGSTITSGTAAVAADLPGGRSVTVRVSAATATTFRIVAELRSPNVLVSDFGPMVLRTDGVGIAEFLGDADNAGGVIELLMGTRWSDSGWRSDVDACPGTHRAITWLVQAGLGSDRHPAVFTAYFAEVSGEQVFLQYDYHSLDLAALDPLAQGLATFEGISIGSTLEQLVEAYGEVTVGPQGVVTLDDGLTVVFESSSSEESSRIRMIEAGSGGCEEL